MSRALPYVWYPAVSGAAIALFAAMLAADSNLLAATYLPVALAALTVVALERLDPARLDWRPQWADVRTDALFMVFVQVALPRVLIALLVLGAAQWTHTNTPSAWWPQHWPLAAQALAMVLAVDFLRYWLHRACHSFGPLWRLHEVHHSPDILYTLNVGRFHPLEKALHFSADTVPFVLLGVAPEVLAAYFLLYSVNGFFQHSNLRLRYGILNYLVGSAETHRWHHARDPSTAYCNFGNTTIVWDLLFGTWYLPKHRSLDIGIPDRSYPRNFWSQMLAPFRRRGAESPPLRSRVANLVVAAMMGWTRLGAGLRMAAAVRNPMRAQRKLLKAILRANRNTTFGREHNFATVHDYRQFSQRVPVCDFEALRPYVEAGIAHGEAALTAQEPVCYLRTSGTTGQPKDVPLTARHLRRLRHIHRVSVARQHRVCPQAFDGSILAITSPAVEGHLANGKPYGSASGVVAASTPRIVQDKFVLPPPVLAIDDSGLRYLTILRLALARHDITYLGAANPSTILALMKLARSHAPELIADLRRGGFFLSERLPAPVMTAIAARLNPMPDRAAELETLVAGGRPLRIADLWPGLRLLVTWTCASAGVALSALRTELPEETQVHELGYLSSEFRGTITLGRQAGSGLPTADTHFFEFVERERWDRGEPTFVTLDQLRKGTDYYVIATTPSGLYRYFINDLVRVTGFLHRMPLLRFLQKGKGVTSITGEKLYEAQVLSAVQQALQQTGRATRFVMMLADESAQAYRLYVETDDGTRPDAAELAARVDRRLCALNIEYHAKRTSARLAPLAAFWLESGTEERVREFSVQRGQRDGQFKIVALAYRSSFQFDIDACVATS